MSKNYFNPNFKCFFFFSSISYRNEVVIMTNIKEEFERIDEEEWPLQDVIFVEDSKNVPVGKVLKVDGPYCAVRFPTSAQERNRQHYIQLPHIKSMSGGICS